MSSVEQQQSASNREPGHKVRIAPIAEPEEVTDVSVQASSVSLEQGSPAETVAARDEPDVHVHFGPDRFLQRIREVLVRRPLSSLGQSVRRVPWWPRKAELASTGRPTDRCAPLRRFRHRFCPPFRVVAEEDASVAQQSELGGGWTTTTRCVVRLS